MEKTPRGSNPGLIWCNSKITKPDELSWAGFCKWYRDIHIPDVLKTGAIQQAFRYEALDPKNDRPHLALYYAEDVEGLYDKVKSVPHHDKDLPGSHDAFDHADFDTRFYKATTLFEAERPKPNVPDLVLSTELSPDDEEDFEKWYRQEHLQEGSKITGWRRTERYELVNPLRTPDAPKHLTLLFLDGDSVTVKDLEKVGSSGWTKRVVGSMKQLKFGAYKKSTHHMAKM